MNKNLLLFGGFGLLAFYLFNKSRGAGVPSSSSATTGAAPAPGIFGLLGGWGAPTRLPGSKPSGGQNSASSFVGAGVNALGKLFGKGGVFSGGTSVGSAGPTVSTRAPNRVGAIDNVATVNTDAATPQYHAPSQDQNDPEAGLVTPDNSEGYDFSTDDFAGPYE